MSGKKKNRNKVKRTGTGPQGQTAPLAEKAAEVILDGEEITNGNGSHVEHEDYVTAPQEDGMVVEVEQSGVEAVVDVGTNGKSSGMFGAGQRMRRLSDHGPEKLQIALRTFGIDA